MASCNGLPFLLNVIYMYPLCIFKIFINSKIRKGAIKIFIKIVFKAQENQRFSILIQTKSVKTLRLKNAII